MIDRLLILLGSNHYLLNNSLFRYQTRQTIDTDTPGFKQFTKQRFEAINELIFKRISNRAVSPQSSHGTARVSQDFVNENRILACKAAM